MKFKTLSILAVTASLIGCGITESNERDLSLVRNATFESISDLETLQILCKGNRPAIRASNKSFEAGSQDLIVKIQAFRKEVGEKLTGVRNNYVMLNAKLLQGEEYILMRNRISNDMHHVSVWLQNFNSGELASNKVEVKLESPKFTQNELESKMCKRKVII